MYADTHFDLGQLFLSLNALSVPGVDTTICVHVAFVRPPASDPKMICDALVRHIKAQESVGIPAVRVLTRSGLVLERKLNAPKADVDASGTTTVLSGHIVQCPQGTSSVQLNIVPLRFLFNESVRASKANGGSRPVEFLVYARRLNFLVHTSERSSRLRVLDKQQFFAMLRSGKPWTRLRLFQQKLVRLAHLPVLTALEKQCIDTLLTRMAKH